MARLFDDANSQRFETDAAAVTAYPLTVHVAIRPDDNSNSIAVFWIGDLSVSNMWLMALRVNGGDEGDPVRLSVRDGASQENFFTTNGITINTWHNIVSSIDASKNISVQLDTTAPTTGTHTRTVTGVDRTSIGRFGDSSPGNYFSGRIGPVTIWNIVLNAEETAALMAGVNPREIRPEAIVDQWRMHGIDSPEPSSVSGGRSLTAGGTGTASRANGPPIGLYTRPVSFFEEIEDAGGEARTVTGILPAFSGVLTRVLNAVRSVSGVLPSFSGIVTRVLAAPRTGAGVLAPFSGIVTRTLAAPRAVAGVLPAFSGTVTRSLASAKSQAGALAEFSGALSYIKAAGRTASGALAPFSGTVTRILGAVRSVTGVLPAFSGTLSRTIQVAKSVTGSLAPFGGSLARTIQVAKSVAGSLAPFGGSLARTIQVAKSVTGALATFSGTVTAVKAGAIPGDQATAVDAPLRPLPGSIMSGAQLDSIRGTQALILSDLCTIEAKELIRDTIGGYIEKWVVIGQDIACRLSDSGGVGGFTADRRVSDSTWTLTLAQGQVISVSDRVTVDGKTYHIIFVNEGRSFQSVVRVQLRLIE